MSTTPIIEVRYASRDGIQFRTPGRQSAVLMDRDGVINSIDGFVNSPAQMKAALMPGSLDALARLDQETDLYTAVLTNQAGEDLGKMSHETNVAIQETMIDEVDAHGGHLDAVYYCPNGPDYKVPEGQESGRKEHGGMFYAVAHDLGDRVDLADSYYIGDMSTDMAAAKAAYPGIITILVQTGFAGKDGKCPDVRPDVVCKDLGDAVDYIIARERNMRLTNA